MKTPTLIIVIACLLPASLTQAAVVQVPGRIEVEGVLDGGIIAPLVTGDTMDYLTFEVLTSGSVTVSTGATSALRLQLAQFIGVDDEFGFLGNPYRLEGPSTLSRILDPGIYVTAMGVTEKTSYDIFDGYKPVNEEGGGFTFGPYAYSIRGPVRAMEFREGNLDGTFTITRIPEPGPAILLLAGASVLASCRRRGSPHATPDP